MALSKTQTVVICAVLASAPLLWQWRTDAGLLREQVQLSGDVVATEREAAALEVALAQARQDLDGTRARAARTEQQLGLLNERLADPGTALVYRWEDNVPVARVPKWLLRESSVQPLANKRGNLTADIKDVLQMTVAEAASVEAAIQRFANECHTMSAQGMRQVKPTQPDIDMAGREVRIFEMPDVTDYYRPLRASLLQELEALLGAERTEFLKEKLAHRFPMDERDRGLSSEMAFLPQAHRVRFTSPAQKGFPHLGWGITREGSGSMAATMHVDDIPDALRVHLQDWIAQAIEPAKTTEGP